MTPTKILIGQTLITLAITLGGLWAATQVAASMLGHQPQLGSAWFVIAGLPVYRPWRLFEWWFAFDAYAPHVFEEAGAIAAVSALAAAMVAVVGSVWRARQNRMVTTYGSSRWAHVREVRRRIRSVW